MQQDIKEKETDFYQILGLDQESTADQIYEQYLKLSLKYHPDKGGDENKFRLVNLAYQVLKNPENRKKYNDALATTFNQFKEENRDTNYHVNDNFVTRDPEQGNRTIFDLEKFLSEFEKTRGCQKETAEINPNEVNISKKKPENLLQDILSARDQDLAGFQSTQKTGLFNPSTHKEEFNYVFNQYKSLHGKELEEVEDTVGAEIEKGEAPVSFHYTAPNAHQAIISQLTDQCQRSDEVVTSQPKVDLSLLEKYVAKHRGEQEHLSDPKNIDYKLTLNDEDKPKMN